VNGRICDPRPDAVADAFSRLAANRTEAAALGDAGFERARLVTWDGVIEKLVGA
jgi:glycosyltransferase involved in cell wall biosynthesis